MSPSQGFDLYEQVRQVSEAPVILMTASDSPEKRTLARQVGVDDYIMKPFSAAELTMRIRLVLQRRRLSGQ